MTLLQFETQVFVQDDLISRKLALSQQTEIPDMATYANAWSKLATDFEACGLLNNAADCEARSCYYRKMAGGAYMREIEMPFAELIPVREMSVEEAHYITFNGELRS